MMRRESQEVSIIKYGNISPVIKVIGIPENVIEVV